MQWHGPGGRRVKHPPAPRRAAAGNDPFPAPALRGDRHNLVLSALVFAQGRMTPLRHAWQSERCQPMVSRVTAAELIRVLAYPKFKLSPDEQQELLADYLPWCATVRIPNPPPETPECRDPFDLPFLQLAVAGKADYLVSGDQDLLSLAGQFACPIVTADQFIKLLDGVTQSAAK